MIKENDTTGLLPTSLIKKMILPVSTLFSRTENYNSFIPEFGLSLNGDTDAYHLSSFRSVIEIPSIKWDSGCHKMKLHLSFQK